MTETLQQVHILVEPNPVENTTTILETPINYTHCMARKSDKTQCSRRRKIGDYCGVHVDKSNLLRIDEPLPDKKKKTPAKNKLRMKPATPTKSDREFKFAIERGARNIVQVVRIQKVFRGWIIRHLNTMRGPALFHRNRCNNQEDIYLFEPVANIHMNDFFSMLDKDGFVYGFHIESIYKYIESATDKTQITNPYNKNIIPMDIIRNIEALYKHCSTLGFHDKIENSLPQDEKFLLRSKVLNVFQKMDTLNNYTDIEWFMGLTHIQLLKLITNIKDLFDYRMELANAKKYKILKTGSLFNRPTNYYKHLTFQGLRNEMIDEFNRLVSDGETRDDRYLGSLIILSGLVELVPACALAYPWLVQGTLGY